MVNRTLLLKTFRDLKAVRVQAGSAALLIACGVGLLVSSLSAWVSLKEARDRFYQSGRFANLFGSLKRAPLSVAETVVRSSGVDLFEPRIKILGRVRVSSRSDPASGLFISLPDRGLPALNRLHLLKGRLPAADRMEACVHVAFAEVHSLQPGDEIEVVIEGSAQVFQIVGIALSPEFIYALSPQAPMPDNAHFGVFWLNRRELESAAGMAGAFNDFVAKVSPEKVKPSSEFLLKALSPYAARLIQSRRDQLSHRFVEDEIRQQRITAVFFPSLFLAVAAFLIHVMVTRLVALHRTQIGALKSMGYHDREVGAHYLLFALLLPALGILPGLFLGYWVGDWLSHSYAGFFRFPDLKFTLSPMAAGAGVGAALLSGCIGGWLSARKAAKLLPSEAMRPWVPIGAHFDRMTKIPLRPQWQMVFRNALGHPLRLGMTLLGLSFAVALLVMARSWTDMITHLLRTQFSWVQKEDVQVSFLSPVRESVLQELRAYPGVLQAEGVRSLPIRVRSQGRQRELLLTAWSTSRKLRDFPSVTIEKGKTRNEPASLILDQGLVMSRALGEEWRLKTGETIELEWLDGLLPSRSVRVAGFTDDRIGRFAMTSERELRRWRREKESWNEVLLKVDGRQREALYLRLSDAPGVASVFLKGELVRGFRSTIAEMIRVSTAVLTGFAVAIALGILLNSIRVAYSERVWELSSLRVLGFTVSEVFWLFWAEISSQVFVSLLPGCALGLGLVHLSMKALHTESIGFPVIVFSSTYARAVMVCILISVGIGVWVWRLMTRIQLGDALKARD